MTDSLRADAAVALATRRDLGDGYDRELVEAFADRIEAEVARRSRADSEPPGLKSNDRIALYAMTLAFGIPITAIAGGIAHLPGIAVAWAGMAACNLAPALAARTKSRR